MMKIKMLISVSCVAALSVACGLDNDSLTLEERAEIAGATDLHIELPESLPEAGPNQPTCGGFLGAVCPVGMQCIDYPGDGCNPNQGGADCLGMCVGNPNAGCGGNQAGKTYIGNSPEECQIIKFACPEGENYFADECGCGCEDPNAGGGSNGGGPTACGAVTCGAGLVCCNASCGICTEPGGVCIQIACEPF
ncbi:MAG: hypothetical protein ACPHRO_09350 [Nannocystaceae bacterium]